jgi:hypothetical protein
MSVATTAPSTVQIRRGRLLWLIVGVAAVAAAITWAVTTVATGSGGDKSQQTASATSAVRTSGAAVSHGGGGGFSAAPSTDAARPVHGPNVWLMKLTPARLAAGALGTGYQLPVKQTGPTLESVLASMSPQTRRWTKAVTGLTFEQLAAGAAGYP